MARMMPPDSVLTVAQRRIDYLTTRIERLKGTVDAQMDKRERKAIQMMSAVYALSIWNIDLEAYWRGEADFSR